MLKFLKGAVVALGLGLSASAVASCPSPVGDIYVFSGQIAPYLDNSVSKADITYAAEKVRPGLADGVTLMTFDYKIDYTENLSNPNCPRVDTQIYLFAKKPVIYVAKELERGSCRWDAVMEHELLHVQIAQRALDTATSALQQSVRNHPTHALPFGNKTLEGSSFDNWLQSLSSQATASVVKQYQLGNDHLDTPEEGTRMEALCNESLRKFTQTKGASTVSVSHLHPHHH